MSSLMTLLSIPFLSFAPVAVRTASPAAVDSSEMTTIVVQNENAVPITVYAQSAFGELKLGVVGPWDVQTLRVPDAVVEDRASVDFFVQPKQGREQDSGYLELHRGEHLGLIVPHR